MWATAYSFHRSLSSDKIREDEEDVEGSDDDMAAFAANQT